MNITHLLQQRQERLRQARLADAAFAYHELGEFAGRIARGGLRGQVTLFLADCGDQRPWPLLVADEGSQAALEEHFTDEDTLDLADLLLFVTGAEGPAAFTFRIEELDSRFRPALRQELERAGIELPGEPDAIGDGNDERGSGANRR